MTSLVDHPAPNLVKLLLVGDSGSGKTGSLASLAKAYIEQSSYSPVQHDLRKPKEEMLLGRVRQAGATRPSRILMNVLLPTLGYPSRPTSASSFSSKRRSSSPPGVPSSCSWGA